MNEATTPNMGGTIQTASLDSCPEDGVTQELPQPAAYWNWRGAARQLIVPALAIGFLATVYWGTFARNLVGGIHDDPGNLMWRATQFEVAHTNGYPSFLCLLRLLYECVPAEKFIFCANASSAVFALISLSLGFVFLRQLGVSRFSVIVWIIFVGLSGTFWSQALFCEVYQFSHVLLLGSLLAMLGCLRQPQAFRFLLVGMLCGLQLTHHLLAAPFCLLTVVVAMILAVWRSPRPFGSPCCLLAGLCLGLLPYLYIPLSWWSHGITWAEGLQLHGKFTLGSSSLYPPYYPVWARWDQAAALIFQDFGITGIVMAVSGALLALSDPVQSQRRLLGIILMAGGVAVPVVFLMRFKPWACEEVLAFYLFPLFCLSIFIPFSLDVLLLRIQALPIAKPLRTVAVCFLSAALFVVFHARLVENYPSLKQCYGDIRYVAVKEVLKTLRPGDTVLSYSCFGSYQFWKLIALAAGLENQLQWGSFTEGNDRASPSQREKLQEFLKACDTQRGQFHVLTDSPDVVLPALQGRRWRVETLFQAAAHEQPGWTCGEGGQMSLGPRNWLEMLSGQIVWELGIGFPSGHLANNLALRWFFIPGLNPSGKLIFSNEFGSNRYARQRVYAVNGSFIVKKTGERIDLDLDPMSHGKVVQSWLKKERVTIPFGLKMDSNNPPQGDLLLGALSCSPPFESNFESRPVVQTLFHVSK